MNGEQIVKVGMADMKVLAGSGVLKTAGLGSCVGLVLYDPVAMVSGMAHVMLPSSEIAREEEINRAKYADTAIPELVSRLTKLGASPLRLKAKMAGGAQMFAFGSDTMRIGQRNVESCKHWLTKCSIPVLAEDTGGNYGRTIEFYSNTGTLLLKTAHQGVKEM